MSTTHRFYRVPLLKIPPPENAVKIGKWSGTFMAKLKLPYIISSKNQFRPQFWAQIVAGVETHPYSPFSGPGDFFFAKL